MNEGMICRHCKKEIKEGELIHAYIIKEHKENEEINVNSMNVAHNECNNRFWRSIA